MSIEELKAARFTLQDSLQKSIADKVAAFEKLTGVSVKSISVETVDVSTLGGRPDQFIVGSVSVDMAL